MLLVTVGPFRSTVTRPPWPTGLQVNPGGPRKPVLEALVPLTRPRREVVSGGFLFLR